MIHPELAELKTWERSEYAAGYGARLSAIRKRPPSQRSRTSFVTLEKLPFSVEPECGD
jgi:hypothetical protein